MKNKITVLLSFIILVAVVLRLWHIGQVPPSPDWDEAALGYNAYSIMETGKDEYGKVFPFVLRSFDDFKPALYTYLAIPFIKIFGPNTVAVRLPSAIFGILTVLATYFLVKELFKKWEESHLSFQNQVSHIALLTSFLLAISPWHIQFSRIAFESNVAVSFNIFAALFFLKGLKKPIYLLLSAILFSANLYTYQSQKVFMPLFVATLILIFRKQVLMIAKKYLVTTFIMFVLICLPMVHFSLTNKDALSRARGVSVFADVTPLLKDNAKRLLEDQKNHDVVGLLLDNRRIVYLKSIISGYFSHFDLNWLFITGDLARHHAPNMGLLYLWELPFLFVGIYVLFFRKDIDKKIKTFIFAWFLLVPIPASITSGVPHAVRTLNFLPTFQIFTALGILTAISAIATIKYRARYLIFSMCFLFFIFNFLYFLSQYFIQQNYFHSQEWQYGYKEAIAEVKKVEDKYDKIVVSNQPHLDQSYIFFLFYLQYPPIVYQNETQSTSGGFKETHSFGKFEFRPIEWEVEKKNHKMLYVGRPDDFSPNAKVIKTMRFLDNKPAISIVGDD